MILTQDVAALLAPLKPATFKALGGADDFDDALDQLKVSPSLFILPSRKLPGEDQALTGVTSQRVTAQFSLIIGLMRAANSKSQFDQLETLEQALLGALHGKEVAGAATPFIYRGGQMVGVDIDKRIMFWGCDFAADFYLRS
jgi:hypothetical protein